MPLIQLAALLGLLAAGPAFAGAWSKSVLTTGAGPNCVFNGGNASGTLGTPENTNKRIGTLELGCYRFVNADGAHFSSASTHGSVIVDITARQALIVLDTKLDEKVTVATTTLVEVLYCSAGLPIDGNNPDQSCVNLGGVGSNSALDGVEGGISVQNNRMLVGPGAYIFRVTGACLVNETCQVSVRGEP